MHRNRIQPVREGFSSLSLVFLAPPYSGKSTRAEVLSRRMCFDYIEVSDLLRETQDQEVLSYMDRGELVPNRVVNRLVIERIRPAEGSRVICGAARDEEQASELLHLLQSKRSRVFVIDGERSLEECKFLHLKRCAMENRLDDRRVDVEYRYDKYRRNIEKVRRVFADRLPARHIIPIAFSDDIDSDCERILSILRTPSSTPTVRLTHRATAQ